MAQSRSRYVSPETLVYSTHRVANHCLVPAKLFTHREFAFTLPGDIYIRYNSFNTADDFKKEVVRLTPARFEIGPQYSARVSHLSSA